MLLCPLTGRTESAGCSGLACPAFFAGPWTPAGVGHLRGLRRHRLRLSGGFRTRALSASRTLLGDSFAIVSATTVGCSRPPRFLPASIAFGDSAQHLDQLGRELLGTDLSGCKRLPCAERALLRRFEA